MRRFARSLRQLVNALEEFRSLGIDFVSLHEGVDTSTINGRLVFGIFATLIRERDIVSFRARCDTISEGGAGARGRGLQSLVVGDLVTLELHIPVSTHALLVNSIVRYIHGRRDRGRCGLQFQSLTEEQHDLIKAYCKLLPLRKRWWWS